MANNFLISLTEPIHASIDEVLMARTQRFQCDCRVRRHRRHPHFMQALVHVAKPRVWQLMCGHPFKLDLNLWDSILSGLQSDIGYAQSRYVFRDIANWDSMSFSPRARMHIACIASISTSSLTGPAAIVLWEEVGPYRTHHTSCSSQHMV